MIWDDKLEFLLKKQQQKCEEYSWMHDRESIKNFKINLGINVACMVIPGIIGITALLRNTIFEVNYCVNEVNYFGLVFYPLLSFIVSFLSGIQQLIKYEQRVEKHLVSSKRYCNLNVHITRMLFLERHLRDDPKEYFNWVNKTFDSLYESSLNISEKIKKLSKKRNKEEVLDADNLAINNNDSIKEIYQQEPASSVGTNANELNERIKYELDRFIVNSY